MWKAFGVRPNSKSDAKFDTIQKYCIYDEPHNDYLYSSQWVEFIVNLIEKFGFRRDNIYGKCKEKLNIKDYE